MTSDVVDGVHVVLMGREHVDALMPYEREMFGTEAWSRGSYLDEIADHRTRHYVAAESSTGDLLGWAGVLVVDEVSELLTVGVVPGARRAGIGRAMLAVLYTEAITRGAREMFLEVRIDNEAALALYAREGFEPIGRRRGYYDGGRVDAVTMRRTFGGSARPGDHAPPRVDDGGPA